MTHVEVKDGNVEGALKRFKIKFQRSGIPTEMKKRKEYSKPGIKRREAKKYRREERVFISAYY